MKVKTRNIANHSRMLLSRRLLSGAIFFSPARPFPSPTRRSTWTRNGNARERPTAWLGGEECQLGYDGSYLERSME